MFDFGHKRKLRRLQKERAKIDRDAKEAMKGLTGDKRHEANAEWGSYYFVAQEEIDELLSDHIVEQAERYDVALPPREEGVHWERMHHVGDRLILTTLGREVTREKIVKEQRFAREGRTFVLSVLSLLVALGGVSVAAFALYFRK